MREQLKTTILLGLLTGLLLYLGKVLGGNAGIVIALIVAGFMNFISYWLSDKIVLSMYGARPISYEEAPTLHEIVYELSRRAGIPKPPIYLIPMDQPNAFATGRGPGHSAVAVTRGLLELLDEEEVRGVLAHEIAHIKNRDVLISSVVATIAGAISMVINFLQWALIFGFGRSDEEESPLSFVGDLLLIIITPILATLIQLAISRSREYLADETGAKLCRCPLALARALEKIEEYVSSIPARVNPATSHLFIQNPLKGEGILELLSTHPPTHKRIERLKELARRL